MENELIVKKIIEINAERSKVWDAITNSELTKKYMYNNEVVSDWQKGSSILWRDANNKTEHVKGIIKEIEPRKYLQTLDLSIDSGLPDIESNYSRVTYELKKENGKTLLSLTEDRFNGDEKRYKDAENFWNIILPKMKDLLEEHMFFK